MVEMRQIVSRLAALSNQNRVPWKATSDSSAFVAAYGDLSVMIVSKGDEPRNTIMLGVYDGQGNLIDSATYDGSNPFDAFSAQYSYSELKPLYRSAKRTALGVDQRLTDLMERMNAAPPVSPE